MFRLCIAGETKDQASSRVDEVTAAGVYRTIHSAVPDSIKDLIRGDLVIGLSYIEPKAIEGERLFVVLVGKYPPDR
jgi:hypothetical protein